MFGFLQVLAMIGTVRKLQKDQDARAKQVISRPRMRRLRPPGVRPLALEPFLTPARSAGFWQDVQDRRHRFRLTTLPSRSDALLLSRNIFNFRFCARIGITAWSSGGATSRAGALPVAPLAALVNAAGLLLLVNCFAPSALYRMPPCYE